jgi:hypothetical protein
MSTHTSFVTDESLFEVASFLDMKGLAALDQVCLLNPFLMGRAWEKASLGALEKLPLWAPWCGAALKRSREQIKLQRTSSRAFAFDLSLLRRGIFPPKARNPWIAEVCFCNLKVIPCEDAQVESVLEWNRTTAAVPLAFGAFRGQPFVVGITIITQGHLDDSLRLGLEFRGNELTASLMFAPFSGNLFMEFDSETCLQASVLKPLDVVPVALRIWIQVFENGAIRFLRHEEDQDLEDVGSLPLFGIPCVQSWVEECLPRVESWIEQYFPCIYVYGQSLTSAALVSVDHVGDSCSTRFVDKPATELDAVWSLL